MQQIQKVGLTVLPTFNTVVVVVLFFECVTKAYQVL